MTTQISPMLAIGDVPAAIEFYRRAFGAEELWHVGQPAAVAGLSIDGAEFFIAEESPSNGTGSPDGIGHTTVRIELFVADPVAVQVRAVAAGAREASPVLEHANPAVERPALRMLQGAVIDPFGHMWLIGRFLDRP